MKESKIYFFNQRAQAWDKYHRDREFNAVGAILKRAGLQSQIKVLDIACGTGILYPFLREYDASNIVAVDISPDMVEQYRGKYPDATVYCHNFEQEKNYGDSFELAIIFNAFPHFENPDAVIKNAFSLLRPGGKLVIAHSMNRAELNEHHRQAGIAVEGDVLCDDQTFFELYSRAGFTNIIVDNGHYFYSEGKA